MLLVFLEVMDLKCKIKLKLGNISKKTNIVFESKAIFLDNKLIFKNGDDKYIIKFDEIISFNKKNSDLEFCFLFKENTEFDCNVNLIKYNSMLSTKINTKRIEKKDNSLKMLYFMNLDNVITHYELILICEGDKNIWKNI